jgi:hypothetical protein
MGLAEHASVAAFSRFVLHLMSLGAPPDLLLDTIQAMKDEVQHARICFGIARQFTDQPAGPGRMDLSNIFEQRDDPISILTAAILEGCFEETISARCAQAALDRAEDTGIRAALARVVDDETRHADLSWRCVGWMLKRYPDLIPTAEACFAVALDAPRAPAVDEDGTFLERYGHLLPSSRRQVEEITLREVIIPGTKALFGHLPTSARDPAGQALERSMA